MVWVQWREKEGPESAREVSARGTARTGPGLGVRREEAQRGPYEASSFRRRLERRSRFVRAMDSASRRKTADGIRTQEVSRRDEPQPRSWIGPVLESPLPTPSATTLRVSPRLPKPPDRKSTRLNSSHV